MKLTFALQKRRQLTRSEAWGCFTANLALPGSGSLVAGCTIGYAQLVFSFLGLGVFTATSLHFFGWYANNWQRLSASAPMDDPFTNLIEIGHALKWPALGAGLVFITLLWALTTSMQILRKSPKMEVNGPSRLPPVIQ